MPVPDFLQVIVLHGNNVNNEMLQRLGLKPEQRLNVLGFHAFQELRVNQVDLIDKMSGMAATRRDSCTSAGRDWVTFAHRERKLFIYVEVRSPSSSTSAMEVIHTDMKPCVLSNVASGTDNCTETLVEQPIDNCRSAEAGTPVCWQTMLLPIP